MRGAGAGNELLSQIAADVFAMNYPGNKNEQFFNCTDNPVIARSYAYIIDLIQVKSGNFLRFVKSVKARIAARLLQVEFCDDGGMVAGFFCGAGGFVYVTGGAFFCKRLCGHYVVEPPAEVSLE